MTSIDWENIVNQNYQAIYNFSYYFLNSATEAEDATQETFLKAWKKRSSLKSPEAAKAWVFQIARNVCYDKKRGWKKIKEYLEKQKVSKEAKPQTNDLKLILNSAINDLSLKQKEVFILRHFFEYSTAETANLLKINEGSVKTHLSRAISKLREKIEVSTKL